jgi:hypothetical protein
MQIHHLGVSLASAKLTETPDHRGDRLAKRRSLFQPGRSLGGHSLVATGATATEQSDSGHIGPDRWQFDTLIDLLRGLRCVRKHRHALRAGGQQPVDRAIGVRMQRPPDAGAAFTPQPIGCGGVEVRFLALRNWFGCVARGLRRSGRGAAPPGLRYGRPGRRSVDPPTPSGQSAPRVLLGVAQLDGGAEQRHPLFRIDSPVTTSRIF